MSADRLVPKFHDLPIARRAESAFPRDRGPGPTKQVFSLHTPSLHQRLMHDERLKITSRARRRCLLRGGRQIATESLHGPKGASMTCETSPARHRSVRLQRSLGKSLSRRSGNRTNCRAGALFLGIFWCRSEPYAALRIVLIPQRTD